MPGVAGTVDALGTWDPDGPLAAIAAHRADLVAGGGLTSAGGHASACLARWSCRPDGPATIYVDCATGDDSWSGRCAEWDGGGCGPKATIQAGLNAAVVDDAVEVAPGTYAEAIDFYGKAVNLHSRGGPDATTIDARGLNTSVVTCASGEGPDSVLEGFTITGGTGRADRRSVYGGGMYIYSSGPTVANCRFLQNSADEGGGMANVVQSEPVVINCTFEGNSAMFGGAIHNEWDSRPKLTGCTFLRNSAIFGAALSSSQSAPVVTACAFIGNTASAGGGAVDSDFGGVFRNCIFSGNCAGMPAGAGGGGALVLLGGSTRLAGCTFSGNFTTGQGAHGGCLYAAAETWVTFDGCVMWGNLPDEIWTQGDAMVTAFYCDVRGGWTGAGNLDEDPSFERNPGPGPDGRWATEDDDFGDLRLAGNSPCIDAGDSAFVPLPGELDLSGNMRVWDGNADGTAVVDMGAYEVGSYAYGDLNCDQSVNALDVNPFVVALTRENEYAQLHPGCDLMLADCNGDGSVNTFDIDAFIRCLAGGAYEERP